MPGRIDTVKRTFLRFQVDLSDAIFRCQKRATFIATHMKLHIAAPVVILISVAIDASTPFLLNRTAIVDQRTLIKAGQVSLAEAHVLVKDIKRLNQSVREIRINRLLGDEVFDGPVSVPCALFLDIDID